MKGIIRQGQGETLVLQHGFLSGSEYWRHIIDRLSSDFDVIALDLPGFAERADEPAIDSVIGFVDDILERLDNLGVENFHLCGHSLGGMIAQELALVSPERIKKLILYATGPDGSMPGRFESIDKSKTRVLKEGPASTIEQTTASWFLNGNIDPAYNAALTLAQQTSEQAVLAGYQAMQSWQSKDRLEQINIPTLVLWPDCDRSYSWSHPQALWQQINGSSLAVIAGCAHNAHLEKPDLFSAIVRDFLN